MSGRVKSVIFPAMRRSPTLLKARVTVDFACGLGRQPLHGSQNRHAGKQGQPKSPHIDIREYSLFSVWDMYS